MKNRPKRMDGIVKLTPLEIAERDARAQHWMNQRKIERVWQACVRARYRKDHLLLSYEDLMTREDIKFLDPITIHVAHVGMFEVISQDLSDGRYRFMLVEAYS